MTPYAIGVDMGGTKIAFVLADRQGNVLAQDQTPTLAAEGADAVIDRIANGIRGLTAEAPNEVVGIGICSPGQVDSVSGYVRNAVNLGWQSVDLRGGLRSRVGDSVPVYMQKDANALALGELVYGAAQGCNDFVYVAVGTGLGGGAITGGQVITGATFFPTEIGHLSLDPNGRLCGCGMRGCPEMYVSGVGFRAAVLEYRGAYPHSPVATLEAPTAADVLRAAKQSDPLALRVLSEGGQWLGAIIACCAGILNTELVVLGGGLGLAAASYLLPEAEKELRRRVLSPTSDGLRFALSEVKESALGAAALVWHELDSR